MGAAPKIDADQLSCEELLDIRNFVSGRSRQKMDGRFSYTVRIENVDGNLVLTTQPHTFKGRPAVLLTLVGIDNANSDLVKLIDRLVSQTFKEQVIDATRFTRVGTSHMRLYIRDLPNYQIESRLKEIVETLRSDLLAPIEAPALNLNPASQSERVHAIRELLTQFLAREGVSQEAKFFERELGRIHKEFLSGLTIQEVSLLHYSVFDRDVTFEAKMTMDERLAIWQKRGEKTYGSVDDYVTAMRSRFIEIAKAHLQTYLRWQTNYEAMRSRIPRRVLSLRKAKAKHKEALADLDRQLAEIEGPVEEAQYRKRQLGRKLGVEEGRLSEEIRLAALAELTKKESTAAFHKERAEHWRARILLLQNEIAACETIIAGVDKKAVYEINRRRGHMFRILERIERDLSWRERLLSKEESWALVEVENENRRSNMNLYAFDVDHPAFWNGPKLSLSLTRSNRNSWPIDPTMETATNAEHSAAMDRKDLPDPYDRDEWALEASGHSAAESLATLEDVGMDLEVAAQLNAVGIYRVFEITRYSAQDFVEKFHFSRDSMMVLLDELNALGIHLHFENAWDRKEGNRVRKERPEYYEHRHTPKIRWQDAPSPTQEIDGQTRPQGSGQWD